MKRADNEYTIRGIEDHLLGSIYVAAKHRRLPYERVRWQVRRDLLAWISARRRIRQCQYRITTKEVKP